MDPVLLKSVKDRWRSLYASRKIEDHLSPNALKEVLGDAGSDMGTG